MFKNHYFKVIALLIMCVGIFSNSYGQVLINEVDADQSGTDTQEFVELYNAGVGSVDLGADQYVLVFYNGGDEQSYEDSIDLTGVMNPGDFLVVGSASVPNVDIVFTRSIQNGAEAIALYSGTTAASYPNDTAIGAGGGTLVDAILHSSGESVDPELATAFPGVSNNVDENANGLGITESIQRSPDGGGGAFTWSTAVVNTPTPGAANGGAADDPNLSINSSIDFGTIEFSTTISDTLFVENSPASTNPLDVTSINITGANAANFTILSSPTFPLAAGGALGSTGTFTIEFDPQSTTGTFNADMVINSNDSGDPVTTVTLTGQAIEVSTSGTAVLIITQVVDGDITGGVPKAIEITNVGNGTATLSNYSVNRAINDAAFDVNSVNLNDGGNGFLQPGESLVITGNASSQTEFENIPGVIINPSFTDGEIQGNGDDPYGLFEGTTLIDIYGVETVDGTGEAWEYTDSHAYRVPNISSGSTTFNISEWVIVDLDGLAAAADYAPFLGSGVAGSSPQLGFYPGPIPNVPTDVVTSSKSNWIMYE